jgi:hypothetical protein
VLRPTPPPLVPDKEAATARKEPDRDQEANRPRAPAVSTTAASKAKVSKAAAMGTTRRQEAEERNEQEGTLSGPHKPGPDTASSVRTTKRGNVGKRIHDMLDKAVEGLETLMDASKESSHPDNALPNGAPGEISKTNDHPSATESVEPKKSKYAKPEESELAELNESEATRAKESEATRAKESEATRAKESEATRAKESEATRAKESEATRAKESEAKKSELSVPKDSSSSAETAKPTKRDEDPDAHAAEPEELPSSTAAAHRSQSPWHDSVPLASVASSTEGPATTAAATTKALGSTTTTPDLLISKDMEDELGQFKYGWDVIARPSTWAPDCVRVVYPNEKSSLYGFDFAPNSTNGVLVLARCRNDQNDRMMWTPQWRIRTTTPLCLTATRPDAPIELQACSETNDMQVFSLERTGRWRKTGLLRNTKLDLCLLPPAYGNNDRRVRLGTCTTLPRAVCPMLWVVTAELPKNVPIPPAAVLPPVAEAATTLDTAVPQRLLDPGKCSCVLCLHLTACDFRWHMHIRAAL